MDYQKSDLRNKSIDSLNQILNDKKKQLITSKVIRSGEEGGSKNPRIYKKQIARILTIIGEKKREEAIKNILGDKNREKLNYSPKKPKNKILKRLPYDLRKKQTKAQRNALTPYEKSKKTFKEKARIAKQKPFNFYIKKIN